MEVLFVLGFSVMLLVTGVSVLGVMAALLVATVLMAFSGFLVFIVKVLPWLLLAVAVAWIYQTFWPDRQSPRRNARRLKDAPGSHASTVICDKGRLVQ